MFGKKKIKTLNQPSTQIYVHYNAGFPNSIYVRGEGVKGLSWEKGIPLKNLKEDMWVFETNLPFKEGAFKVLINDKVFEVGDNHPLHCGASIRINPKFP